PSTSAIYSLSLHDALPIFNMISLNTVRRALLGTALLIGCVALAYAMVYLVGAIRGRSGRGDFPILFLIGATLISGTVFFCRLQLDRKSTRLNSSHEWISYA